MKLITLNIWGGALTEPLLEFLRATRNTTDIYCFQEVYRNAHGKFPYHPRNYDIFTHVAGVLPEHVGHFHPSHGELWGLAMFIKKGLAPLSVEDHFVFGERGTAPEDPAEEAKNVQVAVFPKFSIVNFHGLWNGKGKDDTPERLAQSRKAVEVLAGIPSPMVLAGDFNLNPETDSLKMFESFGLRNLIREYGVTDTRTSHYEKSYSRFADYIFISPALAVKEFRVRPEEVSDHAALELEF